MTIEALPGDPDVWMKALARRLELYESLKADEVGKRFSELADRIVQAFENSGKILLFGNGGSATDAQHAAAEWVGRFMMQRRPLPAVALTADSSILTAIGNDYGFDQVFERQVEALGVAGDVAVAISTTGRSENVLRALRAAKGLGIATVALLGGDGGKAKDEADLCLVISRVEVPLIQEAHRFILHLLCEEVDRRLYR